MSWQLQEHVRIHTLKCSATYISLSEATHFEGFSGACCHQPDSKESVSTGLQAFPLLQDAAALLRYPKDF